MDTDILEGEETPTETPTELPRATNLPPPNVSWSSTGAVSLGLVNSFMGPVDATAVAPVWGNVSGFTGTPVVSNAEARIFGNIISYAFLVSGLTMAPGNNAAVISIPHAVNGGVFTRNFQGGAQVSGSNVGTGQAVLGNARVNLEAANLTVTLSYGGIDPQPMDGGICVFCVYCLV